MSISVAVLFECIALLIGTCLAVLLPRLDSSLLHWASRQWNQLARRRWLACGTVGLVSLAASVTFAAANGWPCPRVHDEFSYLLAADTYAHGRLTNPMHPYWVHFETFHVLVKPTYASKYPPLQGLLLALGQVLTGEALVGVWLSMALASAATCWMLQAWLPPRWALLGGLLCALSPEVAKWWGGTYWGGAPALLGGALLFGALRRLLRRPNWAQSTVLGLGLAVLANSRPFEGLIVSLPPAVVLLAWLFGQHRPHWRIALGHVILPLSVVLGLVGAWMASLNYRVTGDPLRLPYLEYESQYAAVPFFLLEPLPPQPRYHHAVIQNFEMTWVQDYHLQQTLSGFWKAFVFKVLLLWLFYVRPIMTAPLLTLPWMLRSRWVRFALIVGVLQLGAIALTTYLRPHYAAPAVSLLFFLETRGLRQLSLCQFRGRPAGQFLVRLIILIYLVSSIALLMSPLLPAKRFEWAMARARLEAELEQSGEKHLILVRYSPQHNSYDEWVYNEADIDAAPVVWAHSMGPQRDAALRAYFANRHCWLLEADAVPPRLTPCPGLSAGQAR